jgi:hypothetical protein
MVFNEPPLLTALANDDRYHTVFHMPLKRWHGRARLTRFVSTAQSARRRTRPDITNYP